MAYLSIPCRVLYESKGLRSGLTNVTAYVLRPDKTVLGPYPMVEAPIPFFGRYYMDYLSQLTDQPGEYFFMINSPSERLSQSIRIPIYVPPPGVGPVGQLDKTLVVGTLAPTANIVGQFENVDAEGDVAPESVGAVVQNNETSGAVENSNLEGIIYELP